MANKGVCERNKKGVRQHHMVLAKEVYGSTFITCESCGYTPIKTKKGKKKIIS